MLSRARHSLFCALLLLLCTVITHAAETLHVLALRHRPANEMTPLVRSLLRPSEAVTGSGYQLFIRADDSRLADIERLVSSLDVAQRQLTITVRYLQESEQDRARDRVSGRVVIDNTRNNNSDVRYRGERTHDTDRSSQTQTVRVLDGRRAFIRVGQSVPMVQQILALTKRGGVMASTGVTLQDVSTGFDVLPHVRGENVVLDITPRLSAPRLAENTFVFQELRTTVNARIGEWIDLGALVGQSSDVHRAILDSARTHTTNSTSILLKVE